MDPTDYAGQTLEVTWGKEHFQPARFQGMDVGPYVMRVIILDGETPIQAKRRALVHLNAMALEDYKEKLPAFLERVRNAEAQL